MTESKKGPKPQRARKRANAKPKRVLRVAHGEGREALLEAVVRVVVRDGPGGISYRAVAKEAGVTHGLVHYYFGTKDEMVSEAYVWALETELREIDLRPDDAFPERLARLTERDMHVHLFLNEMVLDACRKPELRGIVRRMFDDVFNAVCKALEAAEVPASPARARVIFAAIAGLTVQRMVLDSPKQTREAARDLKEILAVLRDHDRL